MSIKYTCCYCNNNFTAETLIEEADCPHCKIHLYQKDLRVYRLDPPPIISSPTSIQNKPNIIKSPRPLFGMISGVGFIIVGVVTLLNTMGMPDPNGIMQQQYILTMKGLGGIYIALGCIILAINEK